MDKKPTHNAIVSALQRAVKGTPLSLFGRLKPGNDMSSEQFNGLLEDGTEVLFQRRTIAVQQTEALSRNKDGSSQPLPDGAYRLKDGVGFKVVSGRIDFDSVFADPDGVEPFRQYGAWRETVAIDNPLLSLPDPLAVTDVVRFVGADDNFYFAVQTGLNKPYQAYVARNQILERLPDGKFPLPGKGTFQVKDGNVHSRSISALKISAHENTRLLDVPPKKQ
jgi:hypothetical protein